MPKTIDGNGPVLCLPLQPRYMCMHIHFITFSSKPSKFPRFFDTTLLNSLYFVVLFCRMYGLFQTTFYFGYMALFSGALGIICGTVGYIGTSVFVRKIYSNVKID